MGLKERIDEIISRRNDKVPSLEKKKAQLIDIKTNVDRMNAIRSKILADTTTADLDDIKAAFLLIDTGDFDNKISDLINEYKEVITRFSSGEICIAVVGDARQGKSRLLRSISGLPDSVIPAFKNSDCTGASSVIRNIPNAKTTAKIEFRSEQEMVSIIQEYLDDIYGKNKEKLDSFASIENLSVDELKNKIPNDATVKKSKFEHLKKYIEHFDEWKGYVNQRYLETNDEEQIQKLVAQHNGENETSPTRKNYYGYLAVREANISCEFPNSDTGRIVLRDTIGIGDTSLGIREKMLDTIKTYSDAVIIIKRPVNETGKFDENDEALYGLLEKNFSDRNMDKWLFWLLNEDGKNADRCSSIKYKLDEFNWKLTDTIIANVTDDKKINDVILPDILKKLTNNIDYIDDGIMCEIDKKASEVYAALHNILNSTQGIISQGAERIDKTDFLDGRWQDLYNRGLMKLLKEYRDDLDKKKDEESSEFRDQVNKILNDSDKLIPTEEELLDLLQEGGKLGINIYTMEMNKLRTEFTRQFIDIDEEVFDKQVHDFKARVVSIFTSEEGGKLSHLTVSADAVNPEIWLTEFADKYFYKDRYEQFNVAFKMLAEFSLTVRGFLMHRIRDRINMLYPNEYEEDGSSQEENAKKLHLTMKRKLKDVREELLRKFEDELFREPNRVFFAEISEFYDRINFSYLPNQKDVERSWEKFYREHINEVWSVEFEENLKKDRLFSEWFGVVNPLKDIRREDFLFDKSCKGELV